MELKELEFEVFEDDGDTNIISDFFEIHKEPKLNKRIYKGAKYNQKFSLKELPSDEITHQDENYLVGYPNDCCKLIRPNGALVYVTNVNMGPKSV